MSVLTAPVSNPTAEAQAPPAPHEFVIRGDVGPATGDVQMAGSVVVSGNVVGSFKVESGVDVTVRGAVEAGEVMAGRDIQVGGGIVAKGKGRCVAGRNISARFLAQATLEAGGDVRILSDVNQSQVTCGGKLIVALGSLAGGHVTALAGAECKSLGAPSGTKTVIEVGIDPRLREDARQTLPGLEAEILRICKVRKTVEPLLRNQKALSAPQKERATELLFEANEREAQVKSSMDRLRAARDLANAQAKPELSVADVLHAGVVIRFPGLETVITAPLKGPLRIALRTSGHDRRVVLTEGDDGPPHVLPSAAFVDAPLEALNRLLTLNPPEIVAP